MRASIGSGALRRHELHDATLIQPYVRRAKLGKTSPSGKLGFLDALQRRSTSIIARYRPGSRFQVDATTPRQPVDGQDVTLTVTESNPCSVINAEVPSSTTQAHSSGLPTLGRRSIRRSRIPIDRDASFVAHAENDPAIRIFPGAGDAPIRWGRGRAVCGGELAHIATAIAATVMRGSTPRGILIIARRCLGLHASFGRAP